MKIRKNFVMQELDGSFVAVPVGETSRQCHVTVELNETGAFVWRLLEKKDMTVEEIVAELKKEYEGDENLMREDVLRITGKMREANILEAEA